MKLLYATPYFYPSIGGMEHHIYHLAAGLTRKGFDISLLTSRHSRGLPDQETIDGIRVTRFRTIAAPLRNPLSPRMLRHLLLQECDIIHAHDEHSFVSNLAALAAKLRDKIFIQHLFGELPLVTALEKLAGGVYMSTLYRSTILAAQKVIVLSPAYADMISRRLGIPKHKIHVIPNAIDPARYKTRGPTAQFRQRYAIPPKRQVVLYVGAFILRKGIPTLLEAIPLMLKEHSELQFALVGKGPLEHDIARWIHEHRLDGVVHLLGGVPDDALNAAYRAASAVILPTHADVVPTTILEAMLFGKPVISTTIPGIKDMFENVAWLARPGDPDGLARATLEAVSDRAKAEKVCQRAKRLVRRDFRWEDRVNTLEAVYRSLM